MLRRALAAAKENRFLLLALAATLFVHGMAIGSDFRPEDLISFFLGTAAPVDSLLRHPGGHFTATYGLVVLGLRALFGLRAGPYFAVVLFAHLGNVALIHGTARAFGIGRRTAALAAAGWGSAPAFQGTLQWFSAFDHILGVSAMLWALFVTARAAEQGRPLRHREILSTSLVLCAGAATELSGSLVAAVFPLIVFFCLPPESKPWRAALSFLPAAALSSAVVLSVMHGDGSVWARFAAEAGYLHTALFLIPRIWRLFAYGVGVVFAGPLVTVNAEGTSLGLFRARSLDATVTISAALAVLALGLLARHWVRGPRRDRGVSISLLGLGLALYAEVTIARNGFTQDRYHYDAMPCVVLAVALCSRSADLRGARVPRWAGGILSVLAAAWLAVALPVARLTYLRGGGRQEWTRDWGDVAGGSIEWMLARVPPTDTLFLRNDPFKPARLEFAMGVAPADFPGLGAYWVTAHGVPGPAVRRLRFVEIDAALLGDIRSRFPALASTFVSPDEVVRAGGALRTLDAEAPPDAVRYLTHSVDPAFAQNDHAWALRIRRSFAEADTRPSAAWTPAPPTPGGPATDTPPGPIVAPDMPPPTDAIRKSIEGDPNAIDAVRRAIAQDPNALRAIREALQRQRESATSQGGTSP